MAGFASGEGCFYIKIGKSKTTRLGEAVQLNFNISQHSRDEILIKSFVSYLGCGKVKVYPKIVSFDVTAFEDLTTKLLPFFAKFPIEGIKSRDYQDFVKAIGIMRDKTHLTQSGLDEIRIIKMNMNKNRDIV